VSEPVFAGADPVALVTRLREAGCVFAEAEAQLLMSAARNASELRAMADRRAAGVPLEHILGWAAFSGLRIRVRDGVFVPRRRTELLVREAARVAPPGAVVVDLCCGSGAIGAALASTRGDIDLYATDLDPNAVACARVNLEPVGGQVFEGDLFEPLPPRLRGSLDTAVACAPYVPTAEISHMPPEARDHEPRAALDGGHDGLDVVRRIAAAAGEWLRPGGHLLVETGRGQAEDAAAAFEAAGLTARTTHDGDATVVTGVR
jgi:release factor glutamine methyltransferase